MTSLAARQAGEPRLRRLGLRRLGLRRLGLRRLGLRRLGLRRLRLRRLGLRRNRWLWAGVAAAAFGTLVAALTVGLGGSGHAAAQPRQIPSLRPSPARPAAATAPGAGNLKLAQLHVGDCLTGAKGCSQIAVA